MEQSRRMFLQTIGVGIAVVSLPEIPSFLNLFSLHTGTDEDLSATLKRLLMGQGADGAFVAHADTYITEGTPQQLLDSPSALLGIFDRLGLDRSFSDRVNYCEASQCRENFERQEQTWRQHAFAAFTPVKRAPADHDVAIGVGGNIEDDNLISAAGATQYREHPAVSLAGHDPGIVFAAHALLNENYNPSQKESAQRLAVIEKRNVMMDDGQSSTRYETPVSSFIHIARPRRNNRVGRRATGIIAAHNKNDQRNPNNICFADLYT